MTFNEGDGLKTVSMQMCGSMLCLPIHHVSGKKQTIKQQTFYGGGELNIIICYNATITI